MSGAAPEQGDGEGILWCIDPRKRGDISEELVFNASTPEVPMAHKRFQACEPKKGDFTRPNPNSGVVWKTTKTDLNRDGIFGLEETVHRSCAAVTIHDDLLFLADFSGLRAASTYRGHESTDPD